MFDIDFLEDEEGLPPEAIRTITVKFIGVHAMFCDDTEGNMVIIDQNKGKVKYSENGRWKKTKLRSRKEIWNFLGQYFGVFD